MAVGVEWQGSLFGAGAPEPDGSFAGLARTELAGGAWVDHAPRWLAGSDVLFADLVERAPWQQRQRKMYEQVLDEPRLTAWWGRDDTEEAWLPPAVVDARALLSRRYGVELDSVGCNLYRDGRDSVAWHGDTVRKKQATPLVAILSLGEPRRFLLRPRGGGPSRRYELGDGDLLVMGGTCQHTWEHCVPKVRAAGPRMSVTFRHSRPAPDPGSGAG
jgi:alkylated DNA repair dioxygenase AlkB